jgi:hypothetical protein
MPRPPRKVLILDMPFEEALERFICVDVEQLAMRIGRQKRTRKKLAQAKSVKAPKKAGARKKPNKTGTKRRKRPAHR